MWFQLTKYIGYCEGGWPPDGSLAKSKLGNYYWFYTGAKSYIKVTTNTGLGMHVEKIIKKKYAERVRDNRINDPVKYDLSNIWVKLRSLYEFEYMKTNPSEPVWSIGFKPPAQTIDNPDASAYRGLPNYGIF